MCDFFSVVDTKKESKKENGKRLKNLSLDDNGSNGSDDDDSRDGE